MKSPNFRYLRPRSLQHACEILAEHDGDAVALAGGQSLLAGLNLRLSSPRLLVDIGALPELAISKFGATEIRLGALTRHFELIDSQPLRRRLPLLAHAASRVAHPAVRHRGTLGGSLAYADPAAELPACAVALDAAIVIDGLAGEREIKAEDFFTGLMTTALRAGELIVAVRFPISGKPVRFAFDEFARRRGDFAVAGIAAMTEVGRDQIAQARVVYFGCAERAKLAEEVSASLRGLPLPVADPEVVVDAVGRDLDPDDMPGWRASTKLELAKALTRRAIEQLENSSYAA